MRHRILQYEGRRYSLKLDAIVWDILEELAQSAGLRLNELVARVAQDVGDEAGITAALRLFCLREMRRHVQELDERIKALSLTSRGISATLFVQACPAPCFLVAGNQLILDVNEPAQKWMSAEPSTLVGKNIDHYLQIKSMPPVHDILRQYADGARQVHTARVLHVRPGRLVMARASLCPAVIDEVDGVAYFLMIDE
jgi:predicted DNA-binding ribbon-helix-helix protein